MTKDMLLPSESSVFQQNHMAISLHIPQVAASKAMQGKDISWQCSGMQHALADALCRCNPRGTADL